MISDPDFEAAFEKSLSEAIAQAIREHWDEKPAGLMVKRLVAQIFPEAQPNWAGEIMLAPSAENGPRIRLSDTEAVVVTRVIETKSPIGTKPGQIRCVWTFENNKPLGAVNLSDPDFEPKLLDLLTKLGDPDD